MARQSYSVAFEPELMEKVDALAKKYSLTRSDVVRRLVHAGFDDLERLLFSKKSSTIHS